MAPYKVCLKPSVQKDLRALPKAMLLRVLERIEALQNDPLPRGALKLTGAERLYRLRIGDYRVVYEFDAEAEIVTIHYVRHRREVYRSL